MPPTDDESLAELFNERMQRYGGGVRHATPHPRSFLAAVRQHLDLAPVVPYLSYVRNDEVNAVACLHKGRALIGIFVGLHQVLQDTFGRMLATRELFPEVGDPSKEITPEPMPPPNHGSVISSPVVPKDPERASYAALLTAMAQRFVANHEHAHILNGHVGYTDSLGEAEGGFLEIDGADVARLLTASRRQVLELDADAHAVKMTLKTFLGIWARRGDSREELRRKMTTWGLAVCTFFHTLYGTIPQEPDWTRNHPPAEVRWIYVVVEMLWAATQALGEPGDALGQEALTNVLLQTETAYARIERVRARSSDRFGRIRDHEADG